MDENKKNLFQNQVIKLIRRTKKTASLCSFIRVESFKSIVTISTHGIPNLFRTNYLLLKLMWLLLIIASSLSAAYFIFRTLIEFSQFKVTTEVRLINEEEIEFPTVVICNKNPISTDSAIEFMVDWFNKENESITHLTYQDLIKHKSILLDPLYTKFLSAFKLSPASFMTKDLAMESRQYLTPSIYKMLLACRFERTIVCSESDFKYIFNSKYGNCFKFNGGRKKKLVKKLKNFNKEYGLQLDLYVSLSEHLNFKNFENGLYVSIGSNRENYFDYMGDVIDVSTGTEVSILLKRSIFNKYPSPYSECQYQNQQEGDDSSQLSENYYYNQMVKSKYLYSQDMCMEFCYEHYIKGNCGCSLLTSTIKIPDKVVCTSEEEISCAKAFYNFNEETMINISHFYSTCKKECPLECLTHSYDYIKTETKYPSILYDILIDEIMVKNYPDNNFPKNYSIEKDLIRINIYYSASSQIEYKETPHMTIISLISNVGGSLSLFLGMSLLSFAEFLEIILQAFIICCKRPFYKRKANKNLKKADTLDVKVCKDQIENPN